MIKDKIKTKSLQYYRKKADTMLQEFGRKLYKHCYSCGMKSVTLHHYFPKSTAMHLRYSLLNCVPVCQSCHFRHHNGDPRPQNNINAKKGQEWLDDLNYAKNHPDKTKKYNTKGYYQEMCGILSKLL
jgi:5-methylcytosine-specific restriction endonuclease McrA